MPAFDKIFPFLPLAVVGYFAWRYFKGGSLVAALLGGRVTETVGEVALSSTNFTSRVLKVQLLDPGDGAAMDVALSITSRAPLAAGVVPGRLTRAQAVELARLLQRAATG